MYSSCILLILLSCLLACVACKETEHHKVTQLINLQVPGPSKVKRKQCVTL